MLALRVVLVYFRSGYSVYLSEVFFDSFADSLFLNPLAGHRQVMCELSNTLKQWLQS